ncbi:LacI family DNA-binding transcriptional regulator [Microvirga aerophila]|uniref:LacI family transcriptional regulator n=1 Tax=Microvirga aerophila TaxID=670291 RepID=A0A512BZ14_9HYPH|nr:LacI family DNA-binding transcriptional regulator [Microvirga aerophila]GEO17191.1 LacI family transcriptional regulator [Microvirga aerophila]
MNDIRSRATLEDVAALAKVSTATVSRFLNNPGALTASTAERVREAVEAIDYVPNLLAGGLASKRSRIIATLVPSIAESIFNDTIEAMVGALTEDGYMPLLGLTKSNDAHMGELIDTILARQAEALILTGQLTDVFTRERLRRVQITVIETWGLPDDPIDVAVGFSHRAVGEEIARFILDRGYRRPFLVVPDSQRSGLRRSGFVDVWNAAGGAKVTELSMPVPSCFSQGRLVFRRMLEMQRRPDVVICGSDMLAQAIMIEASAAGLRIPDDLAVIGFGNLAVAAAMRPTMTTIDVDGTRIGREAVALLRRRAAGNESESRSIDVGFRIIARESA